MDKTLLATETAAQFTSTKTPSAGVEGTHGSTSEITAADLRILSHFLDEVSQETAETDI
jgi:hypothetical protein